MIRPDLRHRMLCAVALGAAFWGGRAASTAPAVGAEDRGAAERAAGILRESGVRGGLIVHIGCGDGALTAALRPGDGYLVSGIDVDAARVAKARAHIRSLGLYGPVSVDRFDGRSLPYGDNVVNLLVADDLGDVPRKEVLRVLAPGGAALVGGKKTVKARPENVDEWTHFLHDASGNPVAHDELVGPPRRLQWSDRPDNDRSHEHTPSIASVVSSGGRVFYFVDEAPVTPVLRSPKWRLVARDAYNGVLLWERAFDRWWPHLAGWTSGPAQNQRRLVAVGDRVYVTLGFLAPLAALDAATGETVRVYDQTEGAEEVLWHKGILLLSIRKVTSARASELDTWSRLSRQERSPLFDRDSQAPLLNRLRSTESGAPRTLLAIDADTGRVIWRKGAAEIGGLSPVSLCATGDRVFYQSGSDVVSCDLATGKQRWSVSAPRMRVMSDRWIVCADDDEVTTLAAEDGRTLWRKKPMLISLRDAFVINESLWLGGFKPYYGKGRQKPQWGPYFVTQRDLATGEVLKHIEPANPGHHHRCYRNKATGNYILGGRRGTEFIDLENGEVLWNSWARGVCMYGVMPANGLLYVPPNACGCYATTRLTGFYAMAAASEPPAPDASARLQKGAAYDSGMAKPSTSDSGDDWPLHRHDAQRSGCTASAPPLALRIQWRADVGGRLTSPTVAGGMVHVASTEDHRVCALEAKSGETAWSFTAGGRIDSPPSLWEGRAIFGCSDGYVYNLRSSDGSLAWRFRAARRDRRFVVNGQLESAWPVHGSVLVDDAVAFVAAGRNSYLDGGIDLLRIQAGSGELLSRTPIYSPDPDADKQPEQYGPNGMPGVRSDLLSCDEDHVYLRQLVFSKTGAAREEGAPHLLTVSDFLDDTWPHRSYWIYGTHTSLSTGCSGREKDLLYGRLLAFNDSTLYGYGRETVHWSNQFLDGPYRIFAVKRSDGSPLWERPTPVQARAVIVAGDTLFVAGPPASNVTSWKEPDPAEGALLIAYSTADGTELSRYSLDSPPVIDGMAAAGGRLIVSTAAGQVVCLGEER